jgi:hypothetical protein
MTFPGITMIGTHPTFYLIPITKKLSDAITSGQYSAKKTNVLKCLTEGCQVGQGHHSTAANMANSVAYRKLTMQRFTAFKTLAHCTQPLEEDVGGYRWVLRA